MERTARHRRFPNILEVMVLLMAARRCLCVALLLLVESAGSAEAQDSAPVFAIHPFEDGWRIAAGARVRPTGGPLLDKLGVSDMTPAITLGYGVNDERGLTLGVEAGAQFQGAPRAKRSSVQQRIRFDNDRYRLHSVVQVSLGYRF